MAPHLLGIGLEEVVVQTPPEPGDQPAFVHVLALRWSHPGPGVAENAPGGLDDTKIAESIGGLQGIVVELAAVVDPALAWPEHEILVGEHLVPEFLDLRD